MVTVRTVGGRSIARHRTGRAAAVEAAAKEARPWPRDLLPGAAGEAQVGCVLTALPISTPPRRSSTLLHVALLFLARWIRLGRLAFGGTVPESGDGWMGERLSRHGHAAAPDGPPVARRGASLACACGLVAPPRCGGRVGVRCSDFYSIALLPARLKKKRRENRFMQGLAGLPLPNTSDVAGFFCSVGIVHCCDSVIHLAITVCLCVEAALPHVLAS